MYSFPEAFSRAAQAAFEAQIATFNACTQAVFDAARASMAAATVAPNEFMFVQNPEEFMSLAASHSQRALNQAQAFSREAAHGFE